MANKWMSSDILLFAVKLEQECIRFYDEMEKRQDSDHIKLIFHEFKEEENVHLQKLSTILNSGQFFLSDESLMNFNAADFSDAEGIYKQRSCMENLGVLMRKEKALFKLYTFLAAGVTDNIQRLVFESMANDESRHKLKLEIACE